MAVNAKASSITCCCCSRSELWLPHCCTASTSGHRRGISRHARGVGWRTLEYRGDRSGCSWLADRGEPFWVDVLKVIRVGTGLETTVNDVGRAVSLNPVALVLGLWWSTIRIGELRANISHQGMCSRLDIFSVIFFEDLLVYNFLVLGLLCVGRRDEGHLHRQKGRQHDGCHNRHAGAWIRELCREEQPVYQDVPWAEQAKEPKTKCRRIPNRKLPNIALCIGVCSRMCRFCR